ncbi:hypothetical protein P4C99_20240 [Pontiellaceae bacterium B1224]|nr:hypothetical protein [Pontiellaceae bacterium B1224]
MTEGFHEFDEATQRIISQVQVAESRTIDSEVKASEIVQMYVIKFWDRHLKREKVILESRTDISSEDRYVERTRLSHDIVALSKGWKEAQPMLETRLHKDVDF